MNYKEVLRSLGFTQCVSPYEMELTLKNGYTLYCIYKPHTSDIEFRLKIILQGCFPCDAMDINKENLNKRLSYIMEIIRELIDEPLPEIKEKQ